MAEQHSLTFMPDPDPQGYGDGTEDEWRCSCGEQFGVRDIEEAFEHGLNVSRETLEPRDPIEIYGTPEHEAWLIEREREEG